jgi:glycosyltransferase involved in cell wall biosynthesis
VTVATLHVGYKPHQHARLGGVICVNHAQTKRLEGYPGLARVIPNWMPAAEAPRTGSGLRETLGLAANRFVVGAVGRLHPSKGMDILITAFRSCALDDARLVILGEGPQRRELEKLSAGDARIHLPGFRADVHSCLREIDLFVCPSREESFGLAIIEAMGAQRPVIATATEGPAEFMRDQPAVLVPPGSPAALADAIRTAYSQFQRGELAPANYDLTAFDPAPRIDSIIGFYHQVAAARVPSTVELAGKVSVTP